MEQEKILIGSTKKKAKIYVCNNCECFSIPHFIYDTKKYAVSINILEAKYTDYCRSIDLEEKNDLEIFLNSNNDKYNMTNWEVVKKMWNEHNEQQLPKHCHKPYYRNLIEDIDYFNISLLDRDEKLDGGRVYCNEDSEKEPHFHYRLKDGTDVAILFKEAEYMYPLERQLTDKEIENLITFLEGSTKSEYGEDDNWKIAIFAWNNENYKGNKRNNGIFPYYDKLEEDLPMPDYTKLKKNQIGKLILVNGDIIENSKDAEAIVNPNNKYMDYGCGVCGAIYDAAGIEKMENYCHSKWIKDMEVNEIRITPGFELEKEIIHIYAPIYCKEKQPIEKLKEGYLNLFETIKREKYKKVIIPSLGTGFHGYLHEEVGEMVMNVLKDFCKNNDVEIIFNLYDEKTKKIYEQYK